MKKLLLLIAFLWLGNTAIAQEDLQNLYLLFEFMHVDNDQESAYAETENFWEKVHQARVDNGDCIGWDLWALTPGGENQGSQYLTVQLFNDPVKMMEGGGYNEAWNAAYPNLSDEESAAKMEHTANSRDLAYRMFLYQMDVAGSDYDMPLGTLAVINFMKAKAGKADEYTKMESEVFKATHQKRIDSGGMAMWGLMVNMLGYGTEAYASHVTVDMYSGYDQFFNGGSGADGDGADMTEAYEKMAGLRDLKSSYHARLIKKVRPKPEQ